LLEKHDQGRNSNSLKGVLRSEDVAVLGNLPAEDAGFTRRRQFGETICKDGFLEFDISLDFQEFDLHEELVFGEIVKIRQSLKCFGLAPLIHEKSRGEWHEKEANSEYDSWDTLNDDWSSPRHARLTDARSANVVSAVL
jgi:hypothetical protein